MKHTHKTSISDFSIRTLISVVCFSCITCWLQAKEVKPSRTAVFSEVSDLYQREVLPSGRFEAESYVFAEGKMLNHGDEDDSLGVLSFSEIGQIVAPALASVDYHPSFNPEETDLLIFVHWGKTLPYDDGTGQVPPEEVNFFSDVFNDGVSYDENGGVGPLSGSGGGGGGFEYQTYFERSNDFNAKLLGYFDVMGRYGDRKFGEYTEMAYELAAPRYFVILQAFDFRTFAKNEGKTLLWQTRFSVRSKNNRFDEQLVHMAAAASPYFGEKNGSFRRFAKPPKVIIQDLEYLGVEE